MTAVLPVLEDVELTSLEDRLAGARLLIGTIVDPAGVTRSKQVPAGRARAFHVNGMGASPSWNVFCIDNHTRFTPRFGVVGDLRLRADLGAARLLGDGLAWAPAEMFTQVGQACQVCTRGLLRRTQAALEDRGFSALVGSELEMVLTRAEGTSWETRPWHAYGLSAILDAEPFLLDLVSAADEIGLPLAQVHAEYAGAQFEFSLRPSDPLSAADNVILARLLAGRIARRHGLAVSFSPQPFAEGGGNGAHQHLSLTRNGSPLLSGGKGPHGLTEEGEAVIGGIVAGLPDVIGVLAGSVLSASRLQPGHWSGAFACWGLENREAAVRFCAATPGNPEGASIEVKCIDPSANPYLSTAVLLGLALDGLSRNVTLPQEVTSNPAEVAGTVRLPVDQRSALEAMEESPLARRLLGEEILEALSTVRRYELDTYGKQDLAVLTDRFRFAWSI
jgi:glutamine synthetase